MLFYPTEYHEAAAEAITEFFRREDGVRAVLVTNSCARGKASRDSCLDMAVMVAPGENAEGLRDEWRQYYETEPVFAELERAGAFSHVDLAFTDGVYAPRRRGWTSGPDSFELEVGNFVVYAAPLWQRDGVVDELREKWLPYYDENLRAERLADARKYCANNLDHIPLYVDRGLHFQAFHRLVMAMQELMQAVFIARRTYPISYDKWIREQVVEILEEPALYRELVSLMEIHELESDELSGKAERLRALLVCHAER